MGSRVLVLNPKGHLLKLLMEREASGRHGWQVPGQQDCELPRRGLKSCPDVRWEPALRPSSPRGTVHSCDYREI